MSKLTEDQLSLIKKLCGHESLDHVRQGLALLESFDASERYEELTNGLFENFLTKLCRNDDPDWIHSQLEDEDGLVIRSDTFDIRSATGAGFVFHMATLQLGPFYVIARRTVTAEDCDFSEASSEWSVHADAGKVDKLYTEWLKLADDTDLSWILKYGPGELRGDPLVAAHWLITRIETISPEDRDTLKPVLAGLGNDVQECIELWKAWEPDIVTLPNKSASYEGHWGGIGSYYQGAQLSGQNFDDAVIWRAHLVGAELQNCSFKNTSFIGCNLCEADLSDAELGGAIFSKGTSLGTIYNEGTRWPDGFDPTQTAGLVPIDWSFYRLARHVQGHQFLRSALDQEDDGLGWAEGSQFKLLELAGMIEPSDGLEASQITQFTIPRVMHNAFYELLFVGTGGGEATSISGRPWFVSESSRNPATQPIVREQSLRETTPLAERLDISYLTENREECWPRRINPLEFVVYLVPDVEIHDIAWNDNYTHDYGAHESTCVALLGVGHEWMVVTLSAYHSECDSKFDGWGGIQSVEIYNSRAEAVSQFLSHETKGYESSVQPITDLVDQLIQVPLSIERGTAQTEMLEHLGTTLESFVVTPDKFRQRSFIQRNRVADMKQEIVETYQRLVSLCR